MPKETFTIEPKPLTGKLGAGRSALTPPIYMKKTLSQVAEMLDESLKS